MMMKMNSSLVKGGVGWCFGHLVPASFLNGTRMILMYHRVAARDLSDDYGDPDLVVTSSTFELHINELARTFDIVPLEELLGRAGSGRATCAITFDDGWLDNYVNALPILKKYSVPATIFLPANMVGLARRFWFQDFHDLAMESQRKGRMSEFYSRFNDILLPFSEERRCSRPEKNVSFLNVLKGLDARSLHDVITSVAAAMAIPLSDDRSIMNWDEVREMGRHNVTFGSHGMNHYILPTLDHDTKKAEITGSFLVLKEQGIPFAPFFCYPNGDWDIDSRALVSQAGYEGALTTQLGTVKKGADLFALNRVGVHEYISSSPSLFQFRLFQAMHSEW